MVLVRTKFHTVALEEFLNKRSELIKRQIVVGHLTGQGPAEELCLPGTQQATVLNEFRKGKLYFIQNHMLCCLYCFSGTKSLLVATGKLMKSYRVIVNYVYEYL